MLAPSLFYDRVRFFPLQVGRLQTIGADEDYVWRSRIQVVPSDNVHWAGLREDVDDWVTLTIVSIHSSYGSESNTIPPPVIC